MGGGNQTLQPYLSYYKKNIKFQKLTDTNIIHNFGCYIGNFPDLKKNILLDKSYLVSTINKIVI